MSRLTSLRATASMPSRQPATCRPRPRSTGSPRSLWPGCAPRDDSFRCRWSRKPSGGLSEFETLMGFGPGLRELPRIPVLRTWVNKGLARSNLRQVARVPLNESQQPRASFICVGEISTFCSLLAKRQKSDDNHCQQYRGPIQNLSPQVVIVAKQFEVRLCDQQHRIDRDNEDHEIREDVQAFEVD